jgi:hypothetical protein
MKLYRPIAIFNEGPDKYSVIAYDQEQELRLLIIGTKLLDAFWKGLREKGFVEVDM